MQGPGQYKQVSKPTQTEGLEVPPTLAEVGLTKKQSSKAQKKRAFEAKIRNGYSATQEGNYYAVLVMK